MDCEFQTADVFTDRRFGGNPLAVFPDARGLDDAQMQAIAREFNLSETTFVFPPGDARHARRVRIFTPGGELPFAGHPTVGTAFVLASQGALPPPVGGKGATDIVFEEGVGPVPVRIDWSGGMPQRCTLTAAVPPQRVALGRDPDRATLARILSVAPEDIAGPAEAWSCGVPFLVVPLGSVAALARAQLELAAWRDVLGETPGQKVYPVAADREGGTNAWRVRMFAPSLGVPEDPATGSAAASFAGWLGERFRQNDGTARFALRQGIEMGRPSDLALEIDFAGARIAAVRVGGSAVLVMRGAISL